MNPNFLLRDITVRMVKVTRTGEIPLYANRILQINRHDFAMQVRYAGCFYACNGNEIKHAPAKE